MFKKIIYSAMALSITLLPVSEVMAATVITDDTTLNSGSTEIVIRDGGDSWTGGTITNQGGSLTIQGVNQGVVKIPNYIQSDGSLLVIGSTTTAGAFTLQGSEASPATITGGSVFVGDPTPGLGLANGSTLTLGNYSSIGTGAVLEIAMGEALVINSPTASVTMNSSGTDGWRGDVTLNDGTLTLTNANKITSGLPESKTSYTQNGGTLNLTNKSNLTLQGYSGTHEGVTVNNPMEITGGTVNVGSGTDTENVLTIGQDSRVAKEVTVNLYEGNTINLTGNRAAYPEVYPSLTLDNGDKWQGTIYSSSDGYLELDGFSNYSDTGLDTLSIYKQNGGDTVLSIGLVNPSEFWINNENSYIAGGKVFLRDGSALVLTTDTFATDPSGDYYEAMLGERVYLNIENGGLLALTGTGTAIINDTVDGYDDDWNGEVILGLGEDTPTLTLRNVTKDFTDPEETAMLIQNSGTLNIHGNERGGSHITTNNLYSYTTAEGETAYAPNLNGTVNVRGYNEDNKSSLTINYVSNDDDTTAPNQQINLRGNADVVLNTNEFDVTRVSNVPTGTGANNTLTKTGSGYYNVGDGVTPLNMGYNLNLQEGVMQVSSPNVKIGINDEEGVTPYGDLNIGSLDTAAVYTTDAQRTTVVGDLSMNYAGLIFANPKASALVGGNLNVGSGMGSFNQINMMNGGLNTMTVKGTTTINDRLDIKIDVDPQKSDSWWVANDQINSSKVIQTEKGSLNLTDYKLLSQPTRDRHTFHVVNSSGSYTTVGGENKTVSGNASRLIPTYIGDYTMLPSSYKGAFELVLVNHNPEVFRGQVAADVIYANQQVINNQLFDRMVYSILPYFNGRCTNKTASADTLYSPYQYSMTDPGIWFKPYATFETIHMNHGLGKVRNNAYGGMIGADFAKAQWGSWTFIPTAYIGYNGGRTTYNGVGMWHNGGQAGLMGTLTNGDFVTMANIYGGGYHNSMSLGQGLAHDNNALWNAGVASKTVYNIHIPGDIIIQPSLYMSYNYVGASGWNSSYDGFHHKVGALNAFSVAPGLNLIWQKETFSLYALFHAMFNIGSTVDGVIAEVNLPHVGIIDPYFEYGLGASKYFLDRFSGYGQVVARSGSRKGIGFQLGLNLKI